MTKPYDLTALRNRSENFGRSNGQRDGHLDDVQQSHVSLSAVDPAIEREYKRIKNQ